MKYINSSIKIFIIMTILTGILYPLAITGIAQIAFLSKANGSLIEKNGKLSGSYLIGQKFSSPEYFWGRPSAIDYNPIPSGASNLGPTSKKLKEQIKARIDTIRKYQGNIPLSKIPSELLFASASGVDPHISPEGAYFQIERIAKARKFDEESIDKLIRLVNNSIEMPFWGVFGEKRINVLKLNLKLRNM